MQRVNTSSRQKLAKSNLVPRVFSLYFEPAILRREKECLLSLFVNFQNFNIIKERRDPRNEVGPGLLK